MGDESSEPALSAEELEALGEALEADAASQAEGAGEGVGADELGELEQALELDVGDAPARGHDVGHEHVDALGDAAAQAFTDPEMTLSTFFDSWALFGDSALAGTLAGGLLGFLGIYVILRRMVFLSAALSQTASLGIVLAFFLQISLGWGWLSPTMGALVMTFAAIVLLTVDRSVEGQRRDSLLGFVYLLGAAGTLLLGTRIVQEIQDVQTILFGTAVAVVPRDFRLIAWMTAALGAVHVAGWRGFVAVVFDPDDARIRGLPTRALELVLLATIALAVSISTRVLGALPTFAFSVLPAMAALRMSANVQRAMWFAAAIGAASGFLGYLVAFLYELPVGASQALVALAFVPVGELIGRLRALVQKDFARP